MGMGANDDVIDDFNDSQGGGNAGPQNRLGIEPPAGKGQTLQEPENLIEISAGIEKTAQSHIAGNAGEAVEPSHRGGLPDAGTVLTCP